LFEFFSHVGRVDDIRLIRDQRTYKSKGLCYVEFYERESVNKAIALTGQLLGGYPITVQITPSVQQAENKAMRLYVGSLHFNVTDKDLMPVFEAFGPIESIDIHKDPLSGKSRGFGFVTYKNEADAKQALANLDGLEIAGRAMKVGVVTDSQGGEADNTLGELDEGGGLTLTAQSRVQLMQKLQRGNEMNFGIPGVPAMSAQHQSKLAAQQIIPVPRIQHSPCIVIRNMFDAKEGEKDPDFHLDLKDDVEDEASKYGKLKHIHIEKDSAGYVYLRFDSIEAAQKCIDSLNGRWFASRKIAADFVPEATYFLKFPAAK